MTYREAKKYRAGQTIGVRPAPGRIENAVILSVRDHPSAKPPLVEMTVDTSAGVITQPHRLLLPPVLYRKSAK